MSEIWLVRHGQTAWSKSGQHTSFTDLDLTDVGVAEAESLRGRLDPAGIDLVLCSPRLRARRTAELAGFGSDRVRLHDDLVEWNYGEFEGLTKAQIRERVPNWNVFDGTTPGGESAAQVRERVSRVIAEIEAAAPRRALVFSHGHLLRSFALTWLDLELALGDRFPLATATISVLGHNHGSRALQRWNSAT